MNKDIHQILETLNINRHGWGKLGEDGLMLQYGDCSRKTLTSSQALAGVAKSLRRHNYTNEPYNRVALHPSGDNAVGWFYVLPFAYVVETATRNRKVTTATEAVAAMAALLKAEFSEGPTRQITQQKETPTVSTRHGYALADDLRIAAEDVANDERRELMLEAAEEIIALVREVRAKADELERRDSQVTA